MVGDHPAHLQKAGSNDGVVDPHGKVIADRQKSKVGRMQLPDESHIAKKPGIAGKVELFTAVLNQETAGMASGDARAMQGQGRFDGAEGKAVASADMQGMGTAPFAARRFGDLGGRDDLGIIPYCYLVSIAQVISMSMGNQNIVGTELTNADGRQGLPEIKGSKATALPPSLQSENRRV